MKTPTELGPSGRKLWKEITDEYELADHEAALLLEACRVKDRLDALNEVLKDAPVTVMTPQGPQAHPALKEARQQQIVFSRLIASLRLPDEEDERPQRRGGARGAYASRRAYGSLSIGR